METQMMVWFRETFEPEKIHGGIMVDGTTIICGHCGAVISMDNVTEWGYIPWIDLEETILRDLGD